jgi:DNA-binding protein YbaB
MTESEYDAVVREPPDLSGIRERFAEFDAILAGRRYRALSRDRATEATVNGHGALIDLKINDRALRSAHPQIIGSAIVEAINTVRAQAASTTRGELGELIQNAGPAPRPEAVTADPRPTQQPEPPARTGRPTRQRPTRWDDYDKEEPLFKGLSWEG